VRVLALPPEEVPRHLAAADAGICFLGRHASKLASSPTKFGEYLACGLPVITNPWIGDAQTLAREPPWLLVDAFSAAHYRACSLRLAALLEDAERTRAAARELAVREFALDTAIDRYHAVYEELTAGLGRSR
jgi:glycosyltransferase involved in cell wall biosynthesis